LNFFYFNCFDDNNADSNTFLDKHLKRNFNYWRSSHKFIFFFLDDRTMHVLSFACILFCNIRKLHAYVAMIPAYEINLGNYLAAIVTWYSFYHFYYLMRKKRTRTVHCVREIRYTNKNIRLYLMSSNDTVSVSLSSGGTHII